MKRKLAYICRRFVLVVLGIFAFVATPMAQPVNTGYLGKGKDQYSVFVFGDALAGGLWAGMARVTLGRQRIKLNGRYREGSGLAKLQFYDWTKRLPATLDSKKVDIAVVFIGTNDAQDIRRNAEYLVFNSKQWREVYTSTVAKMMSQLTANNSAVYWLEAPPVNRPELDERLKIIAAIHKEQALRAGIRFVETRKSFVTADGKFAINGAGIDGSVVRLRSRNGIRFIKSGNDKLASIVIKQIDQDIAIADGDTAADKFPVPDSSKIASNESAPYQGPIFASASSDNQPFITQPENMPLAGAGQSTNVLVSLPSFGSKAAGESKRNAVSGANALQFLKTQVPKNGPANALFFKGIWPEPQAGRLDNFTGTSR